MEIVEVPKESPLRNNSGTSSRMLPEDSAADKTTAFIEKCETLGRAHFGIESLRPIQRAVLQEIAQAQHILATLPTGAGKTLLYALPALAQGGGPVLVICPLISLMRDQVRRMHQANVKCVLFTSDQTEDERRNAYSQLNDRNTRLIFVSPERLILPSFIKTVARLKISMAVVDEAHCIVSWGPGFRPEYAQIGKVLARLSPPKVLALTATASATSRKLIRESIFPPSTLAKTLSFSPLGKNIFVQAERVYSEDEKWSYLVNILSEVNAQKAIVYFPKREQCTQAAMALRKLSVHAVAYHAGMTKAERLSVESYLASAKGRVVVCATQAFGMGIDLTGVGLVVVYGFPGNIEEFFQMAGRAGRGGEPAQAVLLWSGSDPKKRNLQFADSYPDSDRLRAFLFENSSILPGISCRRLVPGERLLSGLNVAAPQAKRQLPGMVTALRLLGGLETPLFREDYVWIRFHQHACAEKVLLSLPSGVTRRSRFLEALCGLADDGWRKTNGGESVFPKTSLCEESSQIWEKCLEIIRHFEEMGVWEFKYYSYDSIQDSYILKGNHQQMLRALPYYLSLRSRYHESLAQLEKLALGKHCRLAASEEFFAAREISGAARTLFSCKQCDLCVARELKGRAENPFKTFARLRLQ